MIIIIGIILGIGSVIMYITISTPEVIETEKIVNCYGDEDCRGSCGNGTFYHTLTNSCETYPEIEQDVIIEKIKDGIDRFVSDITFDEDGNRIVPRDSDGIPIVDCTPYENEQYSIDRKCKMTFK